MRLWELVENDANANDPQNPHRTYDCYESFIIRASTEAVARQIASEHAGDETAEFWLNPKWSDCKPYEPPTHEGETGIVYDWFHPG